MGELRILAVGKYKQRNSPLAKVGSFLSKCFISLVDQVTQVVSGQLRSGQVAQGTQVASRPKSVSFIISEMFRFVTIVMVQQLISEITMMMM